jgi:hypothetical protein
VTGFYISPEEAYARHLLDKRLRLARFFTEYRKNIFKIKTERMDSFFEFGSQMILAGLPTMLNFLLSTTNQRKKFEVVQFVEFTLHWKSP